MKDSGGDLGAAMMLVTRAAEFAARRHAAQRRKGLAQEPYINHLAEVARLLAETAAAPDPALIAAGWLHDTLEDTETEREELVAEFGADVAELVSAVTDDKSLPKPVRKDKQIEDAAKKSDRAKALKIADKISNLRSLASSPPDDWERERMLEYVQWAEKVVAGCRGVNEALERLFDAAAADARGAVR